jgi:hypothetical protein
MSITAVLQIADQFLNSGLEQQVTGAAKTSGVKKSAAAEDTGFPGGDTFTSSQQSGIANTAAEAGIFQVGQFNFATSNIGTQVVPSNANATANAAPQTIAANTQPATPLSSAAVPANTTTAATAPGPQSTQNSLQTLNSALAALGLTAAEIQAFDQFASVILQTDPNALQDLQAQLNALASRYGAGNANNSGAARTAAA